MPVVLQGLQPVVPGLVEEPRPIDLVSSVALWDPNDNRSFVDSFHCGTLTGDNNDDDSDDDERLLFQGYRSPHDDDRALEGFEGFAMTKRARLD